MSDTPNKAEHHRVATEGASDDQKSVVQELRGLTVAVVAPLDDQTSFLVRELQRLRIRVRRWLTGAGRGAIPLGSKSI